MSPSQTTVQFRDVTKQYPTPGGRARHAIDDVSLSACAGEIVAITGRSGSGKSTLLHLAAGIDTPTSGQVLLNEQDLQVLTESQRTRLRRDNVGLVFQFFHLLPHLTVFDNVALPGIIAGHSAVTLRPRIHELLDRVGLRDRVGDGVNQLSGGEMQRVAICRALLQQPRVLLADEPTGNLDDESGESVMSLILELCRAESITLLYVTHSVDFAALADRVLTLHSGRLTHP